MFGCLGNVHAVNWRCMFSDDEARYCLEELLPFVGFYYSVKIKVVK